MQRRVKTRVVGFAIANMLFIFQGLIGYVGVLLGLLPQEGTDTVAFIGITLAYNGPFFAFLDAPGESRSWEERFKLYIKWWLMIALSAVLFWELPWYYLEDNLLRLDRPMNEYHEDLRHLWIFWGYGVADNRFLNGDPTVLSVEFLSVHTGLVMLPAYFAMQRDRIWGYWVGAVGMSGVAFGTIIYVISEWYVGWPHINSDPFEFWVKFLLTQTPYIFNGGLAAVGCLYVSNRLAIREYLKVPVQTRQQARRAP